MQNQRALFVVLWTLVGAAGIASRAAADFIPVFGGPTWDQTTRTGYITDWLPLSRTAGNGLGIGYADRYSNGGFVGTRAIRWDDSGSASEMGSLGTRAGGSTYSGAYATNVTGVVVGYSEKYSGGLFLGTRAVRWDSGGTPTELANLGTNSSGMTDGEAYAINAAGVAAGYSKKFMGDTDLGSRAVRWDALGEIAELGNIGDSNSGSTSASAKAINDSGVAVGGAAKYINGSARGSRAVRWDASGVAAELGNLGTDNNGITNSGARGISSTGAAVGYAEKYTGGNFAGYRPVRWDASSVIATELECLGTDNTGHTDCQPMATNTIGTAVGYAKKYVGGADFGERAVRWDASGSAVTELAHLGTDTTGTTYSHAYAINTPGYAVGYATRFANGSFNGRAVLWNSDAAAIDINSLIDPNSGWTLTNAWDISDTNWVTGTGSFDPDGAGPLAAYNRAFLVNVSNVVPEPAGLYLLGACAVMRMRRRR